MKKLGEEVRKTAKLVARHWEILEKLYHKRYYESELADELKKEIHGVCAALKELRDAGLVKRVEPKGERHNRKYHVLTDKCRNVVKTVKSVAKEISLGGKVDG